MKYKSFCFISTGLHVAMWPVDDFQSPVGLRRSRSSAAAGLQSRQHSAEWTAQLCPGSRVYWPGWWKSEHGCVCFLIHLDFCDQSYPDTQWNKKLENLFKEHIEKTFLSRLLKEDSTLKCSLNVGFFFQRVMKRMKLIRLRPFIRGGICWPPSAN